MSKTPWTPGTWAVTTEHYAGRGRLLPVWKVNATTTEGVVIGVAVQPAMSNEDTAPFDANLIAAAPEYDELLGEAIDIFEGDLTGVEWKRAWRDFTHRAKVLRSKARGEQ